MPRGLKKIAKIAEEGRAKREAYDAGGDFQRALVLKPGQVATGRFCEEGEDVVYVYTHDLPKKAGQSIADKILCLDQEDKGLQCYGCELLAAGNPVGRSTRLVMNFIRYDEPKLQRDAKSKPIKDNFGNYQFEMMMDPATGQPVVVTEMALLIFTTGSGAGGRLDYLETQKGGLTRHVCTIARTSDNTSPYMIDVAQENKVPPSPEEIALFNKKIDPLKAITQLGKRSIPALSYGDMIRAYGGSVASGFAGGDQGAQSQTTPENNVYAQAAQNEANKVTGTGQLNLGAFAS